MLAACLPVGCDPSDTGVLPADSWLADRTAAGWRTSEVAECPPYIAAALRKPDESIDGPGPYRIRLGIREGAGVRILKEWSREDGYYILAEPRFYTAMGNRCPVLGFRRCHGDNAWAGERLSLFELDGSRVTGILPRLRADWPVTEVRDVDGDGTTELLVLDDDYEFYAWCCHAASPGCFHVFRWDAGGREFMDRSADYPAFYESAIAGLRAQMTGAPEDNDEGGSFIGSAVEILLHYSCMGRAQEGWRGFEKDLAVLRESVSPSRLKEIAEVEADLKRRLKIDSAR